MTSEIRRGSPAPEMPADVAEIAALSEELLERVEPADLTTIEPDDLDVGDIRLMPIQRHMFASFLGVVAFCC
jgi:hypothetical protein